jgi:hypothetical protein
MRGTSVLALALLLATPATAGVAVAADPAPVVVHARLELATRGSTSAVRVTGFLEGLPSPGGRPVQVTVTPVFGDVARAQVFADEFGSFALVVPLPSRATVSVEVPPAPGDVGGAWVSSAVPKHLFRCTVARAGVRNQPVSGVCRLPGVPRGTQVRVQYQVGSRWFTVGTGRSKGARLPFTVRFGRAGRYPVRVLVAANRTYRESTSAPIRVVVR